MGPEPPAAVTTGSRWRRRVDVLQRRVGDAWVLLAVDGDDPLLLEGTGAAVWGLLDEPRTLATLVDAFAAATDGTPHAIRADLQAFLADLEDQDLVERA